MFILELVDKTLLDPVRRQVTIGGGFPDPVQVMLIDIVSFTVISPSGFNVAFGGTKICLRGSTKNQ